ncbi:DUF6221 family protein [Nonomuraea wenchangensis]
MDLLALDAQPLPVMKCRGRCGKRLTDPVSRRLGYGPDCAERLGIITPSSPRFSRREGGDCEGQTDLLETSKERPPMDDPTYDLITFLREQLTAREERAKSDIDRFDDPGAAHQDPRDMWIVDTAREVLKDIEAMQAALDQCEEWGDVHDFVPALKALAARYADESGYRPEWAPERTDRCPS